MLSPPTQRTLQDRFIAVIARMFRTGCTWRAYPLSPVQGEPLKCAEDLAQTGPTPYEDPDLGWW
jgi:hypothetical protein